MSLYHYTDVNGLLGIVTYKKLWSTDINFLNDSEEYAAGIRGLKLYIESEKNKCIEKNRVNAAIKIFFDTFGEIVKENIEKRNTYITSFTRKSDNLRQWMSYCPANSGYCIEFNEKDIPLNIDIGENILASLEVVDYDEGYFDKYISKNIFSEIALNGSQEDLVKLVRNTMFHCCSIKNSEFQDEDEVRLVVQSSLERTHTTKYRSKAGVIIPYIEFPIKNESISKIIVGPNVNGELALRGLTDFLLKNGVECEVELSKCSLRAL